MVHIIARVASTLVSLDPMPFAPTRFVAFTTPKHMLLSNSDATCEYFPVLLYPRYEGASVLASVVS
jgi:hypothetical protein